MIINKMMNVTCLAFIISGKDKRLVILDFRLRVLD